MIVIHIYDTVEDQWDLELAQNAAALYRTLALLKRDMRNHLKHDAPAPTIEELYETLHSNEDLTIDIIEAPP